MEWNGSKKIIFIAPILLTYDVCQHYQAEHQQMNYNKVGRHIKSSHRLIQYYILLLFWKI